MAPTLHGVQDNFALNQNSPSRLHSRNGLAISSVSPLECRTSTPQVTPPLMTSPNQPVIVDWSVVSPIGHGRVAFTDAFRAGRGAISPCEFEGIGPLPVGAITNIADRPGEDRAITLLDPCFDQLAPALETLDSLIPPDRRGVCAATSKGALMLYLQNPSDVARHWMRLGANDPALHLARRWNASGPAQAYVGACATGLMNILQAAQAIEDSWCDVAIAGSSEATLHSLYLGSFLNLKALARTGSYPFDARHHGFVAGEGAALFLLARRDVAERAGLSPIACLAGSALGADAYHPVGIDTSGGNIARVGRLALERAGWKPETIDLVSAHGTATVANDTAESAALRQLFPQCPPVHGIKGATGHLMGAAGAVELAACLAAIEGQFVPATVGFETPAPECGGITVLRESRLATVRRVLKWSFGFGGHLVAAAVEKIDP